MNFNDTEDKQSNREDEASTSGIQQRETEQVKRSIVENNPCQLLYLNDPVAYENVNYRQIDIPPIDFTLPHVASTSSENFRNMERSAVVQQPTTTNQEIGSSDEVEIIDITGDALIDPKTYNKIVGKYNCRFCGWEFSCTSARWHHENNKHAEKAMLVKIVKKNALEQRRQGLIGFPCHYCTGSFPSYQTRYAHEKSKHGTLFQRKREAAQVRKAEKLLQEPSTSSGIFQNPLKKLKCSLCPMKFEKENHLKLHLMKHRTERPCICQICGRSFKAKAHLNKHYTACKNEVGNFNFVGTQVDEPDNVPETEAARNQGIVTDLDRIIRNLINKQKEADTPMQTTEPEMNSQDELAPSLKATSNIPAEENNAINSISVKKETDIIRAESSQNWDRIMERTPEEPANAISEEQIQNDIAAPHNSDHDSHSQTSDNGKNIYLMEKDELASTTNTSPTFEEVDPVEFDAPLSDEQENIERTSMPLSAVIYTRALQNTDEMIVVYLKELEIDVVSAAHSFSNRCVIVVENLNMLNLTEQMYQLVKGFNPQMVNVTQQKSQNSSSIWSVITFNGETPPCQLNNRLVKNMSDMEMILASFAMSKQLKITNVMRYEKKGLYQYLSHRLSEKTVACNFTG